MSYSRNPTEPPTVLPSASNQYAIATDQHTTSRSFNTMSSTPPASPTTTWLQIHSTQVPQAWISPLCGAGAGFASGIVTCPLDVIKTKLQAQGGFANRSRKSGTFSQSSVVYRGMIGTGRTIWRDEGVRGMYRGLGPMLMGYLPTWAVYLSVYDKTRQYYFDMTQNWWIARCYSSITAGACSTILTNPIWVIKTRLMSQSSRANSDGVRAPWHYTSTLDAVRKMYRSEGILSFYSGLTPALLGLTHVAVQFPLYEYFKMKFTGYGMGVNPPDSGSHYLGITAATFLSKICASTATYPHEVVRTRLQTQQRTSGKVSSDGMMVNSRYKGVLKTCQVILREEGWRAFYAGIGTNLIRAVPAAMTTMLTYEYLQGTFQGLKREGEKLQKDREGYREL